MKKLKRLSPATKKAIRDRIRPTESVRLSEEVKAKFVSDAPSFAQPETEGLGDFELYARKACEAVGVPFELDPGKVYHHVGYFTGNASVETLNAFVQVYNITRTPHKYVFNYEEYLDAIKRVGRIQAQLDAIDKHEESERERWHKHQERIGTLMASESDKPIPSFYAKPAPAEPPDWDLEFLQMYSISSFKASPRGYQAYIDSVAYDLARILDRPIPFYLEENPDKPHGYVLGTSGSGKSELLKLLIHTYISNSNYGSVVVIDPTSDFVSQIARWKEFNKESERLIYFRPTLARGMTPIINPFEIYGVSATDYSEEALDVKRVVAQELVEAIGHIVDQPSAPMRTLLMNCVLVLLDKEGATLEDLNNFMMKETNNELVQFAGGLSHHEHVASYFSRKDGGFNNPANKMTKDAINRRLDELLSIGTFKKLTCGKSTFHLEEAVNDKKVILFDLGRGAIGPKEGSDFGRLVIAILLGMAYRRANLPEVERIPCSLIVDECQNFVTKSMTDILNEARKYRLFITLAQLVAGQFMPIELRDSLLQNTNLQVVGGTTRSGAKRNADLVGVETSDIETLETGEFYTKPNRSLPAVKFKTRTELLKYKNSVTKEIWNLTRIQQIEKYYTGTLKKAQIDFEEEPDTGSQKWD